MREFNRCAIAVAAAVVLAAIAPTPVVHAQPLGPLPPKYRNVDVTPPRGLFNPYLAPQRRRGNAPSAIAQAPQQKAPLPAPPAANPTPTPSAAQKMPVRGPQQEYRECLGLWDKGTHMTRAEWAATCTRVQSRLKSVTGEAQFTPGRRRFR